MKKRAIGYILKELDFNIASIRQELQKETLYIDTLYMELLDLIGWEILDKDKTPIELNINEVRELVISRLDYCVSNTVSNFNYVSLVEYESQKLGGIKYSCIFSKRKLSATYLAGKPLVKNKCINLYKDYWS